MEAWLAPETHAIPPLVTMMNLHSLAQTLWVMLRHLDHIRMYVSMHACICIYACTYVCVGSCNSKICNMHAYYHVTHRSWR